MKTAPASELRTAITLVTPTLETLMSNLPDTDIPSWDYPKTGLKDRVRRSRFSSSEAGFRALLIKARKQARLTQADLAAKLDRPQSFVSKYEGGERRLDVLEFLQIANAIGFNPAKFLADFERLS